MKKAVILTEEEFNAIEAKINNLMLDNEILSERLTDAKKELKWEINNRPAIEASAEAGKINFYSWCEQIAKKYEDKDYNEWLLEKARWYNNGLAVYAKEHKCETAEDVYEEWQWDCGYDCCIPDEYDDLPTEGWTELAYAIHYHVDDPTVTIWFRHYWRKGEREWDSLESIKDYNDLAILVGNSKWPGTV